MGYRTYVSGSLTIQPGLFPDEIAEALKDLEDDIDCTDAVYGRKATVLHFDSESRSDGHSIGQALLKFCRSVPNNEVTGSFTGDGEERDDLWQMEVEAGTGVPSTVKISWATVSFSDWQEVT